jgi:prolyl 4-hydroxylase
LIYFDRKIQTANVNRSFEKSFLDGYVHDDDSSHEEEETKHATEETTIDQTLRSGQAQSVCQASVHGPNHQTHLQVGNLSNGPSSVTIPETNETTASTTSMNPAANIQQDATNPPPAIETNSGMAPSTSATTIEKDIPSLISMTPQSKENNQKYNDKELKVTQMDHKPSQISIEENDCILLSKPEFTLERQPESRKVISFGKLNCVVKSKSKNGIFVVSVKECRNRIGVLYAGDIITHLNGKSLSDTSVEFFVSLLQQVGERRELTVISPRHCENNNDCCLTPPNLILSNQSSGVIPQRTSTFIHFSKLADANIARIENRVAELFSLPNHCIEPLQLVKYEAGQYFAEHHDTGILFDDYSIELPPKSLTSVPRRIITVLVYLSDVPEEAGGKTVFPLLNDPRTGKKGVAVTPKRGMALIWCNINKYGLPDKRLVHAGEPLHTGAIKYAMNIWLCEE